MRPWQELKEHPYTIHRASAFFFVLYDLGIKNLTVIYRRSMPACDLDKVGQYIRRVYDI